MAVSKIPNSFHLSPPPFQKNNVSHPRAGLRDVRQCKKRENKACVRNVPELGVVKDEIYALEYVRDVESGKEGTSDANTTLAL